MTNQDNSKNLEINIDSLDMEMARGILNRVVPIIIHALLEKGELDKERLGDHEYVQSILMDNLDLVDSLKSGVNIDNDFVQSANEAVAVDRKSVAVVLIATAIEHKTNSFFRKVLEYYFRLSPEETTEAIRSSFHVKLGWLMTLVSGKPLPEDLKKKLKMVTDLRNGFVHYKAHFYPINDLNNTGYDRLLDEVDKIGIENILELPNLLEIYLTEIEFQMDPYFKLATDTYNEINIKKSMLSK